MQEIEAHNAIPPSPASSSDVEEESHPITPAPRPQEKKVKGILKKPSSATYPRRTDSFGVRGQSRGQRSMSAHAHVGIRDSVDLAREHSDRSNRTVRGDIFVELKLRGFLSLFRKFIGLREYFLRIKD